MLFFATTSLTLLRTTLLKNCQQLSPTKTNARNAWISLLPKIILATKAYTNINKSGSKIHQSQLKKEPATSLLSSALTL